MDRVLEEWSQDLNPGLLKQVPISSDLVPALCWPLKGQLSSWTYVRVEELATPTLLIISPALLWLCRLCSERYVLRGHWPGSNLMLPEKKFLRFPWRAVLIFIFPFLFFIITIFFWYQSEKFNSPSHKWPLLGIILVVLCAFVFYKDIFLHSCNHYTSFYALLFPLNMS